MLKSLQIFVIFYHHSLIEIFIFQLCKTLCYFPSVACFRQCKSFINSWAVMGRPEVVICHHCRHQDDYDTKSFIQCHGSSYVAIGRHAEWFIILARHGSS